MAIVYYLNDYTPGVKAYTLETRKPVTRMEAKLSPHGRHYYVDTTEKLKGRGIAYRRTHTADNLTKAEMYKVGWSSYLVSLNAFKVLTEKHPIAIEKQQAFRGGKQNV